ncbi:nuclease [Scytonema hofmannii PCC 7110]|uniref:Nuclease n=1 Tax=Scytonema hofmannii PCC 7110 TaxID=128403 RepID=A0A139WUJ6_9CYAN|nr:DUF3368 domain-containing protein [Scytonema hofmannii]KYC36111.1 nuclease [Scytonema hofmannii PCC 7110]
MSRRWVINASPLIVLAKISQINLILQLCAEVVIPSGVVQEINTGPNDDPAKIWLSNEAISWIREIEQIDPLIASWDLGLEESHVLSWVYSNPGYEAILDDRAAKNAALALRVPVRGTLGVILLAKQEGIVPAAKPIFEQLVQIGFSVICLNE